MPSVVNESDSNTVQFCFLFMHHDQMFDVLICSEYALCKCSVFLIAAIGVLRARDHTYNCKWTGVHDSKFQSFLPNFFWRISLNKNLSFCS